MMRHIRVGALAVLFVVVVVYPALAQQGGIPSPIPNCAPNGSTHLIGQMYPTNDLEPEFPIWCYPQPEAGAPTRVLTANGWTDTFDNDGPAIQTFNDGDYGYRVFDNFIARPGRFKPGYFVNSDHWMLDIVDTTTDRLSGGIMVSPDRQFAFEDGVLVIEVDAAAGSDGMGGANRFYEIDVSPAPAPTGITVDSLYGYGAFGTVGAIGCRMERNDRGGNFVCTMYDDSGRATDGRCVLDDNQPPPTRCSSPDRSGRVWETQGVGTALAGSVTGNDTNYLIPGGNGLRLSDVWRQCGPNEHDLHCRDRFRMEVSKSRITLYVNGYQAMQINLTDNNPEGRDARIPDSWFQSGVRPYFTSWVNGGQHTPIRWHWNEVRVNPREPDGTPSAPSASPSFCLGRPADTNLAANTCPHMHNSGEREVPPPHTTPQATPTSVPIPTSTVTPTRTPTPLATATATPFATATATPTPTTTPVATPASHDAVYTCTILATLIDDKLAMSSQQCVRIQ